MVLVSRCLKPPSPKVEVAKVGTDKWVAAQSLRAPTWSNGQMPGNPALIKDQTVSFSVKLPDLGPSEKIEGLDKTKVRLRLSGFIDISKEIKSSPNLVQSRNLQSVNMTSSEEPTGIRGIFYERYQ